VQIGNTLLKPRGLRSCNFVNYTQLL